MQVPGSLFFSVPQMKNVHAGRVPVLESAFEIKLPWLLKQAKEMGTSTLVITDGDIRTVVELTPTRLATKLGGQVWVVDIVPVPCLGGRVRPLLKCPRAHEGNFQSLYFRAGELACRHCHALRYRSSLAATPIGRARLARIKLILRLGGSVGGPIPSRKHRCWQKRHARLAQKLTVLSAQHYSELRMQLSKRS